ncbi:DNA cytosine methyltransferase [Prevotella pallens]|uniref:DNA cytosine methyltransferase n=1 Tax=Prevotella pallens TaxID=60133 RepID=UPI0028DC08BB|nr:DNA cytosine methyltransferase [Prevotella pallens]
MKLTHASLFSGIGGAELAASWLGWTNVFHCEIQEFQRKVLEYWFPNSISYEDITKTDFKEWRGQIDVLTGGFPCQPFSVAGKRKGAEDNRYLWDEMLRVIREIQPTWVVGENVNGILSMVQPGKETKMERTDNLFDENFIYRKEQKFTIEVICEDLERAGYSVQPFVIPACAVGAPHRRDRVWIVARLNADTDCQRCAGRGSQTYKREKASKRASVFRNTERPCSEQDVANSTNAMSESVQQEWKDRISKLGLTIDTKFQRWIKGGNEYGKSEISQEKECREEQFSGTDCPQSWWWNFPTQSPVCSRDDGLPFRVADLTISFPKWRSKSIEALGNAWVPQVAFEIFKAINEIQKKSV